MQLIILCGVQASGKSSFYQQYFAHTHLRLNLDMLKIRHREHIIFEAGLASKTKMVIDNTNPDVQARSRYIQPALDAGFEVLAYYFDTDLKSTLLRNSQRIGKAKIPEVGVRATYKKLEMPSLSEGFQAIYQVKIIAHHEFSIQVFDTV
jgi:predicted kinase